MKRKWSLFAGVVVTMLAMTSVIFGQQQRQVYVQREATVQGPEGPAKPMPPDHTFTFVSSEMNFDGKLVKGAPYSAKAVTETTQTLGDGNRIINKSEASVYRDGEGRTRREQSLRAIGPFATTGEPAQAIFINDPVAGVNYSLDTRSMVARKMLPMKFEFKFDTPDGVKHEVVKPDGSKPEVKVFTRMAKAPADRIEVHNEVFMAAAPPMPPGEGGGGVVMQWHGGPEKRGKTESLGKQTIEGIEADGTRNVTIIPAGEIGNERPIEIVFERWYSPELQTVVMTRHIDPRFGETSYRLTSISRDEPARSLFEVPSGYTIKETGGGAAVQQLRMKKAAPPTQE